MSGSKTVKERIDLINSIEKIIFVSKWVQKRFFLNIDDKLINKTEIVYPSIHKLKTKTRKKKNNSFCW